MTNQYDPKRMTTNRIRSTANSKYSDARMPPPKRVRKVLANPTTIPMEPVINNVLITAPSSFLLVPQVHHGYAATSLRGRAASSPLPRPQGRRSVPLGRSHPAAWQRRILGFSSVVLLAVESPVYKGLDAAP